MATILVVDDTPICREPLAAALRGQGYTVVCASDGEQALAQINQAVPDLILLDLAMPLSNGLKVTRAIKTSPALAGIPIILLTALEARESILCAAAMGIRDYVLKTSFSPEDLFERVRRRLAESGARPAPATPDVPGPVTRAASAAPGDGTSAAIAA